ncbi:hypothetical protein [Hoeflea sp.]|uniref:hypothetical protein n=1 Tax=Hoeflea sp. TaxID=1940281 RepID=UPI00374A1CA1
MDLKLRLKKGFRAAISILVTIALWLFKLFTRHELWVLRRSMAIPILSPFVLCTLMVWVLPLGLIAILLDTAGESAVVAFLRPLISVPLVVGVSLWFFPWFFTIEGLLLGRHKRAQTKETELIQRLARLT